MICSIDENPADEFLLKVFEGERLGKASKFVYLLNLLPFPEFTTSDKTIA
jgi:hypothetical protein